MQSLRKKGTRTRIIESSLLILAAPHSNFLTVFPDLYQFLGKLQPIAELWEAALVPSLPFSFSSRVKSVKIKILKTSGNLEGHV